MGLFECDIPHRRSVYYDAIQLRSSVTRVTRVALVAYRYTYELPRCRTLQSRRTFIALSVSLWNDLAEPVFGGMGLSGFKSRTNTSPTVFPFSSFILFTGIVGLLSSD